MAPLPCHLQALLPELSELGLKQIERIGNLILSLSRQRVSRSRVQFERHLQAEFTVDISAFCAISGVQLQDLYRTHSEGSPPVRQIHLKIASSVVVDWLCPGR